MSDPLHERVVAAIGHQYQLEGEIGRGGMSVVFRARDLRLNRPVAIKVVPPELAYDPAVRTRFTREAQTAAKLGHPHIVPIYDVGEADGVAYLVMSLVTGGSLAGLLAREPRQPVDEVRRLLCEIADALAYAHLHGVIHRDIKPDNILLDADSGRAMVTDFGIARAMEAGTRLTVTGVAVGTPTYMSPEQAAGDRQVDGRSDIYSLGVVAYQMLTGRVPFTAGNSMALLLKHVSERPQPIAELRPETPRGLREAVERALMKHPEDRWPSAVSLRDALAADAAAGPSWRTEHREPVRYTTPRPDAPRRERASRESTRSDGRPEPRGDSRTDLAEQARRSTPFLGSRPVATQSGRGGAQIVHVPEHLAQLTPEQRKDLRVWNGRVELMERINGMRGYAVLTLGAWGLGMVGFAVGVEELPPLLLGLTVPVYMSRKLWLRGKSLRAAGLKLRRVLLMPRAKWVLPKAPPTPEQALEKLAPREVVESPEGAAIRRAVADRDAILEIVSSLPKGDRALLPDLVPTVNGLVDRVAELAQALHRLDRGVDPRQLDEIDARISAAERATPSPDEERRLGLLRRQRDTLGELVQRRSALSRQLESAGLTLSNLRLDMVKLRASGLHASLSEVTSATQEARALSHEIGAVLEAVSEMRRI